MVLPVDLRGKVACCAPDPRVAQGACWLPVLCPVACIQEKKLRNTRPRCPDEEWSDSGMAAKVG